MNNRNIFYYFIINVGLYRNLKQNKQANQPTKKQENRKNNNNIKEKRNKKEETNTHNLALNLIRYRYNYKDM